MKALIAVLFLVTAPAACKKDDCCDDPGVNQAWLDTTIADIEKSSIKQYFYIVRAEYEGTCVAYVNGCCPSCLMAILLYRCDDGTKIENVDVSKITNPVVIWRPENSSCDL
jgi:hypothetical protein